MLAFDEPNSTNPDENTNPEMSPAELSKLKKKAIKQLEEVEIQLLQTMGMMQFSLDPSAAKSGALSPFGDDIVSEEKFKEWNAKIKNAKTEKEIGELGKEIEEATNEEFNKVVFSKTADQGKRNFI